jgi:putative hydrolase of the HAD superfamily
MLPRAPVNALPLPWVEIDSVLLDLDGTLLDLAFDSYIWMARVPELYAAAHGLSVPEAVARLRPKFAAREGTLDWYCIDYWTRELGLDIADLHRLEQQRIDWLPGAPAFLDRIRAAGKRLVVLTNSHPVILAIKHERTRVREYVDVAHSSHEFGVPKEDPRFWEGVRARVDFDPARTLYVDDSLPVLRAARRAGIRWVVAVARPDSSRAGNRHEEFPAVEAVADLLPA